jgi:hypothetical protein
VCAQARGTMEAQATRVAQLQRQLAVRAAPHGAQRARTQLH